MPVSLQRSRLKLTAADRRYASVAEFSVIVDRGVISVLRPQDLLHMVRTACGGIGISALRSNQLIFALGAITQIPLGCDLETRIPMDLVREANAVFRKRDTDFGLAEYPVEFRASREMHILYRGRTEMGPFEVWVLHGYYPGMSGTDECVSVVRKGECSVVDANTSALFLDSDNPVMVR